MASLNNSGTISWAGTLTVSGATTITGGTEEGGGTTVAEGGASLFNGASENFTLNNYTLQLQGASQTAAATADTINLANGSQLIIENGATFSDQGAAFTIESTSGSGSLINDGTYSKIGTGTTDVEVALTNNGVLNVDAGTLVVSGNVTGSGGDVVVTGLAVADFEDAFHQNVTFSGAGTLELGQSLSYGGTVSGFAAGDVLDLADLAYSSSEYLVWTQVTTGADAAGTIQIYSGSGVLEETLNLDGTYSQSDFLLASDANPSPGTEVVEPEVDQWNDPSGGSWTASADWSTGSVPISTDDVLIGLVGSAPYTVTIASGTSVSAASVTVNSANATLLDQGTLTLTGALLVSSGIFDLVNGGTVSGGTLQATGGSFAWNGGTLSGVTYDGTMNLSASSSYVYVTNGLTMAGVGGTGTGTIDLTGQSAQLYAEGTETLNNATVNIGSNSTDYIYNYDNSAAAVLTLGPTLTIDQTGSNANLSGYYDRSGSGIVNEGTINAEFNGGTFTIGDVSFTNAGTINVANGDTVDINSTSWSNSGSIDVSGGTLNLGSSFTFAQLGTLNHTGGIVNVTGTLNDSRSDAECGLRHGTGDADAGFGRHHRERDHRRQRVWSGVYRRHAVWGDL